MLEIARFEARAPRAGAVDVKRLIYRSDKFIWGKLRHIATVILVAVFCPDLATTFPHNNWLRH